MRLVSIMKSLNNITIGLNIIFIILNNISKDLVLYYLFPCCSSCCGSYCSPSLVREFWEYSWTATWTARWTATWCMVNSEWVMLNRSFRNLTARNSFGNYICMNVCMGWTDAHAKSIAPRWGFVNLHIFFVFWPI